MDKAWKPFLSAGTLLTGVGAGLVAPATSSADSITTTTGFNVPVVTGSQKVIASYYVTGNPAGSSANFNGYFTDPHVGLDLYVGSYTDYQNNISYGNNYSPGQSFTTGSTQIQLNSIGYALGDADSASIFSAASETIKIYKLNGDGTLSSVYTSTTTGSPYNLFIAKKNTQFNFSNGPTLAANSTYVFTVSLNSNQANATLLTQAQGTNTNPHGTTTQQLVSVNNSDSSFLTYSGYSNRENSSGDTSSTVVSSQADFEYSNGTTKIYTPNASPNISGTTKLGIFNGANAGGIDQLDFYVIGTAVPEPASLGLLGVAGLGLLARRRRNA